MATASAGGSGRQASNGSSASADSLAASGVGVGSGVFDAQEVEEGGSKRTMSRVLEELGGKGLDVAALWREVQELVRRTCLMVRACVHQRAHACILANACSRASLPLHARESCCRSKRQSRNG
jgi:hypothetical protein